MGAAINSPQPDRLSTPQLEDTEPSPPTLRVDVRTLLTLIYHSRLAAPSRRIVQIGGSSERLRQHAELTPEPVRSKVLVTRQPTVPSVKPRG